MDNFYCFKCDKLTRHFTMGKVVATGTTILRCSGCGEGAYCKGKLAMLKEIIGGQ